MSQIMFFVLTKDNRQYRDYLTQIDQKFIILDCNEDKEICINFKDIIAIE